jgi:hypothetical protein
VHGYLHNQRKKGSSSLTKLGNKPDWFLYIFKAVDCDATTLWTERCLATHGIFHATKKVDNTPAMDVARVYCP